MIDSEYRNPSRQEEDDLQILRLDEDTRKEELYRRVGESEILNLDGHDRESVDIGSLQQQRDQHQQHDQQQPRSLQIPFTVQQQQQLLQQQQQQLQYQQMLLQQQQKQSLSHMSVAASASAVPVLSSAAETTAAADLRRTRSDLDLSSGGLPSRQLPDDGGGEFYTAVGQDGKEIILRRYLNEQAPELDPFSDRGFLNMAMVHLQQQQPQPAGSVQGGSGSVRDQAVGPPHSGHRGRMEGYE